MLFCISNLLRRTGALLIGVSASLVSALHAAPAFAQDAPLSDPSSANSSTSAQGSGDGQYASSEMPFDVRNSTVGTGTEQNNFLSPFFQTILQPRLAPAGANDWNCKPSDEHPNPVILVHGTIENAYNNWAAMAPVLKRDGYCVFAPNLGRAGLLAPGGFAAIANNTYGLGQVEITAEQLGKVVDEVLKTTGASKVDLVGHSQGGIVARYYAQFLGGTNAENPDENRVGKIVTLGATNHGTTLTGWADIGQERADIEGSLATEDGDTIGSTSGSVEEPLNWVNTATGLTEAQRIELKKWLVGWAGAQQAMGSDLLAKLNEGGDTRPGIAYTVIGTEYDNISTPYTKTFLTAGPNATVRNITLQEGCVQDQSSHISMSYSPRAIDYVRNALDPEIVPESAIRCAPHKGALGFSVRSLV